MAKPCMCYGYIYTDKLGSGRVWGSNLPNYVMSLEALRTSPPFYSKNKGRTGRVVSGSRSIRYVMGWAILPLLSHQVRIFKNLELSLYKTQGRSEKNWLVSVNIQKPYTQRRNLYLQASQFKPLSMLPSLKAIGRKA